MALRRGICRREFQRRFDALSEDAQRSVQLERIYVGPNVGYGSVNTGGVFANDRVIPATGKPGFVDLHNLHDRGLLGGGQIGYSWQTGPIVLGLEGDISSVDWDDLFIDRQVGESFPAAISPLLDLDFLATVRGRVGLAADNWLFYVTGGAAFLDGEFENSMPRAARIFRPPA